MSEAAPDPAQGGFPHDWQATILKQRPLILPRRHYVYPREAEEIERGALELLVQPIPARRVPHVPLLRRGSSESALGNEPFLATCALGFADPLAPTGVWSCPNPAQLCAVAGGYAYLITAQDPEDFAMVAYRPVLAVYAVHDPALLLFFGNKTILAYDAHGKRWESPRLSDEGLTVHSVENGLLRGSGWDLRSDLDTEFVLDLRTGTRVD